MLYPKEDEVCVAATSSCLGQLETYRASMADIDLNDLPKICRYMCYEIFPVVCLFFMSLFYQNPAHEGSLSQWFLYNTPSTIPFLPIRNPKTNAITVQSLYNESISQVSFLHNGSRKQNPKHEVNLTKWSPEQNPKNEAILTKWSQNKALITK